jgi:hypothetical protein
MCRSVNRLLLLLTVLALSGCNLRTDGATLTPLPTLDMPRVQFTAPANRQQVVDGAEVVIDVLAEDSGAGVARIQLWIDDLPQTEATPEVSAAVPVFAARMRWMAQGTGMHSLTAIAYRQDGTASAPATMLLEVIAPSP